VRGAEKAELRQRFIAARRERTDAQIASARRSICEHVTARCQDSGWHRVAAYEPLRTEPGSLELLDQLRGLGIEVLVPVVHPDKDLGWVAWATGVADRGTDLGPTAIASVDAAFVPALAVAADGTRLGRGGGSYDRALARAAGVPIVALIYADELVAELPRDGWDLPVTAVVTPNGWRELR
jgi:5-formyltetrahydrofolate cyclo-ligase